MEDNEIVALFWARSEQAIKETASQYGNYCYVIAYHILFNPQDAEEAVNDTYFCVWNNIPPHRPAVLKTFLGKMTRRISLKKYRDKNREKRGGGEVALALNELDECIPSAMNVEDEIIAKELGEILNQFIVSLPDTERRVFLCRYWYLDSIETISKEFHFSGSKVKSMLHRTRKKLRYRLQQEGIE